MSRVQTPASPTFFFIALKSISDHQKDPVKGDNHHLPDGLVVRIPRSHRGGPGSIPGQGTSFLLFQLGIIYRYYRFCVAHLILGSIVVSIPACHAGDQGSIPCQGAITFISCQHSTFNTALRLYCKTNQTKLTADFL